SEAEPWPGSGEYAGESEPGAWPLPYRIRGRSGYENYCRRAGTAGQPFLNRCHLRRGSMKRPRILLADDHAVICAGFQKLLEPQYEVVGSVGDGLALLKSAPELKPDLILLDVGMPLLNGLNAGRELKKLMPNVKLVFLTMNPDPDVA